MIVFMSNLNLYHFTRTVAIFKQCLGRKIKFNNYRGI